MWEEFLTDLSQIKDENEIWYEAPNYQITSRSHDWYKSAFIPLTPNTPVNRVVNHVPSTVFVYWWLLPFLVSIENKYELRRLLGGAQCRPGVGTGIPVPIDFSGFWDWDWDRFFKIFELGLASIFQNFGIWIGLGITNSGQNPKKSQRSL